MICTSARYLLVRQELRLIAEAYSFSGRLTRSSLCRHPRISILPEFEDFRVYEGVQWEQVPLVVMAYSGWLQAVVCSPQRCACSSWAFSAEVALCLRLPAGPTLSKPFPPATIAVDIPSSNRHLPSDFGVVLIAGRMGPQQREMVECVVTPLEAWSMRCLYSEW